METIVGYARHWWSRFAGLFASRALVDVEPERPQVPERRQTRERRAPAEKEFHQAFYFKSAILDQLDRYFFYLKRLRREDRDAYDVYSRVGALILPETSRMGTELSPWFRRARPALGAVTMVHPSSDRDEDRDKGKRYIYPKFMHFVRYKKPPPELQRVVGGDIYKCGVYFDRKDDPDIKNGHQVDFGIALCANGDILVLRSKCEETFVVRSKRGWDRGNTYRVTRHNWGFPSWLIGWAAEHGETVEGFLRDTFIMVANQFEAANGSMVRVNVKSRGLMGVFCVEPKRTAYFFKDREATVNAGGSKRRIFHVVRPHARLDKFVKLHFRGERKFVWNGYNVAITVPGRDHIDVAEFDVGALDVDYGEVVPGTIGMATLGERLAAITQAR